jgi:hypothetical protein
MLFTHEVAIQTSRQIAEPVLCRECEQLLNRNGERYTLGQMFNKKNFPLLQMVKTMTPAVTARGLAVYSCATNREIDTEALAYFALSLLWKAGAHPWRQFPGMTTDIYLGPYQEVLRKYLRGETGFPANIVVKITLCTDRVSQHVVYEPTAGQPTGPTTYSYYELLTNGINFGVCIGAGIPTGVRKQCCVSSPQKWVFVSDCEARTISAAVATRRKRPSSQQTGADKQRISRV